MACTAVIAGIIGIVIGGGAMNADAVSARHRQA
jgi:hypothetical protein